MGRARMSPFDRWKFIPMNFRSNILYRSDPPLTVKDAVELQNEGGSILLDIAEMLQDRSKAMFHIT